MNRPAPSRPDSPRLVWVAITIAIVIGVGAIAIGYPLAIDGLQQRFGIRGITVGLGAIFLMAGFRARLVPSGLALPGVSSGRWISGAVIVTLVAAFWTEDARFLRLVPAWVYLGLAIFCFTDSREDQSLIEKGVRFALPGVPPFIGGYCSGLTAAWGGFFLVSALVIAILAISASAETWRSFTARDVWLVMAGASFVEFFVRKTWFRYYYWNGPFERFWSRLFPAERTARGRRSLAYIASYREQFAREAEVRNQSRAD